MLSSASVAPVKASDHARGSGSVRVIVYGDYLCPYCAKTELVLSERDIGRAFRHFPVTSKHPRARVLACAAEAAACQGRFWEMHDSLFADQGHLDDPHLWARARRLELDLERFQADRRAAHVEAKVTEHFQYGVRAGVMTTPTLVIDGKLYPGVPSAEILAGLSQVAGSPDGG